jgi:hypothetical protein
MAVPDFRGTKQFKKEQFRKFERPGKHPNVPIYKGKAHA